MTDAVFYVLRSGCAWRMLPREFPPWPAVFSRFRRWRLGGTLRRAHDVLRVLARRQAGRASIARVGTVPPAEHASFGPPERVLGRE
jgi:putative transposase